MLIAHLVHILFVVYMYLNMSYFVIPHLVISYLATILTVVHIVLSLIIVFRRDSGLKIEYPKFNVASIIQRDSAFLMAIMLPFHARTYKFMAHFDIPLTNGQLVSKLIHTLIFFALVFVHISISVPRAVVTAGKIRNEMQIKKIEKISIIACIVLYIIASIAVIYVLAIFPRI